MSSWYYGESVFIIENFSGSGSSWDVLSSEIIGFVNYHVASKLYVKIWLDNFKFWVGIFSPVWELSRQRTSWIVPDINCIVKEKHL